MDLDCTSWCHENKLSENTIQELVKEELTSIAAMEAITIAVTEQFQKSIQRPVCILRKTMLQLQTATTARRGVVPDAAAPQDVAPQYGYPLLATGIDRELADVKVSFTKTEGNGRRECSSNQSGGFLHTRPHGILYIRSRPDSGDKIRPLRHFLPRICYR